MRGFNQMININYDDNIKLELVNLYRTLSNGTVTWICKSYLNLFIDKNNFIRQNWHVQPYTP